MRTAMSQIRNGYDIIDLTVLFLFGLGTAKVSHLASQYAVARCAENGKYPLSGLAHVCIASEDKRDNFVNSTNPEIGPEHQPSHQLKNQSMA